MFIEATSDVTLSSSTPATTNRFARRRRNVRVFAALAAAVTVVLGVSPSARSRGQSQPIFIDAEQDAVAAGDPLPCAVSLTGPSDIHVYSSPLGVVSYNGTADASTTTVNAATNPNAAPQTVTVYVQTDGATVAQTQVSIL